MTKPSIAELLSASGYTEFTLPLVMRAMYSLYGNIGANLDERDWSATLQSSNPLQASEDALRAMYQDSGYLLRNTLHLTQSGYVAAQAEITYRQMAGRLDYTYNPAWSDGTAYDYLGDLTYEQLVSLVPAPPPPPPLPTISVSASATGFSVLLNVAGTVKLSVSGDLGNFAAGSTIGSAPDFGTSRRTSFSCAQSVCLTDAALDAVRIPHFLVNRSVCDIRCSSSRLAAGCSAASSRKIVRQSSALLWMRGVSWYCTSVAQS